MDLFAISPAAVAYRIRLHAKWLGVTLTKYYRDAELNADAMKQAISGKKSTVGRIDALKIRKFYGLTLDYIYAGDRNRLPIEFQKYLDQCGHRNDELIVPREGSSPSDR